LKTDGTVICILPSLYVLYVLNGREDKFDDLRGSASSTV